MDRTLQFEENVYKYITENRLLDYGDKCVIGVSGGADSVCLLTVLARLAERHGLSLYAVHVNHMIRGDEALRDERYVEKYCMELSVPLKVFHIDVPSLAKTEGLTLEEAGRRARYEAFEKAGADLGIEDYKIAVAHNKNDLAETVILNMARGTGMPGLKGIPVKRGNIVRPLLNTERNEIEEYLNENRIGYVEDFTNLSDDYTRNKIRHNIIPELSEVNSQAVSHIGRLAGVALDYDRFVSAHVEAFLNENCAKKTLSSGETAFEIGINILKDADNLIENLAVLKLIEMAAGKCKDIGESHVAEVKKLYDADSGSRIFLPYGVSAVNSYGNLQFYKKDASENNEVGTVLPWNINVTAPGAYALPSGGGTVRIEIFDKPVYIDLTKKMYTKFADYDKIQNGLSIRNYLENDYMVIDSEGHTKKLNRLFSSCKVPIAERAHVPLVASGHKIIWAVGVRLGENYKVTRDTKKIIKFEYFLQ